MVVWFCVVKEGGRGLEHAFFEALKFFDINGVGVLFVCCFLCLSR